MHRQIRDEEIFFLWKIKPYGSYTNQIHRGMVLNTYTWTKINTRHIRPGWITYSSFPFPPSVGKIQHGHHFTKGNVISNFFCFCSVETLYLQQKILNSWTPHNVDQKNDSHPLCFYWIFVPVAAACSPEKRSRGEISYCFFPNGYFEVSEHGPASIACSMCPNGSFPSFWHSQQYTGFHSSMHYRKPLTKQINFRVELDFLIYKRTSLSPYGNMGETQIRRKEQLKLLLQETVQRLTRWQGWDMVLLSLITRKNSAAMSFSRISTCLSSLASKLRRLRCRNAVADIREIKIKWKLTAYCF